MPFESVVNVPQEIRDLVVKEISDAGLYFWWTTPLKAFNNRRPMDAWQEDPDAGTKEGVISFIKEANHATLSSLEILIPQD